MLYNQVLSYHKEENQGKFESLKMKKHVKLSHMALRNLLFSRRREENM